MVVFAPFVVCGVCPSTQGTFCWGVTGFSTDCTVVMSSAFDTDVKFVTIFARVPILLTPHALWYGWFGRPRGFYLNDFVLDGLDFVDIFVIFGWFKIYEEYVQLFFGLPMSDVYDTPYFMSRVRSSCLLSSRSVVW